MSAPWGVAGGSPGAAGENLLQPQGDEDSAVSLADNCTIRVHAGDVIRMRTPGSEGLGSATRRPGASGLEQAASLFLRRGSGAAPQLIADGGVDETRLERSL
ncbi:MAG: hydantoinase B/oxoprolinase family protein [Microthrixaceae bacterium]|nr:hydantoinase B/oxoprolinase family protein [Microthrixaceae bacterium]